MDGFTQDRSTEDLQRPYNTFSLKVDSKGRILIPAQVRKSLDIDKDTELSMYFKLSENLLLMEVNGDE